MPPEKDPKSEPLSPKAAAPSNEQHDTLLLSDVPELSELMPSDGSAGKASSQGVPQFPTLDLTPLSQRYELLAEAGHGSMGNVYKARDRETGETVALKLLKPEIASDQNMMERFKKELLFARKITHKNVCRVHDFNRIGGIAFTSMEFVEGESLRSLLNDPEGLSQRKAMDIALQMCAGLQEAHAQGIVHRDLKPENVMIDEQGNVKIMDFGIARSMDAITKLTGSMVGTPAYMSPEQVSGKKVDVRSDIYSMGLILYELFTGEPAFQAENAVAMAMKQMREAPKPPREVRPSVPPGVEAAILKCLEKEPVLRFKSAAEIADALRKPDAPSPRQHPLGSPVGASGGYSNPTTPFASHPVRPSAPMASKDPFKPAQPSIPGVPAAARPAPEGPVDSRSPEYSHAPAPRKPIPAGVWVALGLIVVLSLGGAWMYSGSRSAEKSQPAASDESNPPAPGADSNVHAANLPIAPGIIGSTKELEKPWASKRFLFRSDLSNGPVPALVVHLPNGQYWAVSMIEPFGSCQLEYVTDLNALRSEYDFRADHPMIGDPCTHTVYDLSQYDSGASDGGLVRGAIVHGAGVRPPMAIEIEVEGKQLRAVRME
jgi:serine/threonine protein kinase